MARENFGAWCGVIWIFSIPAWIVSDAVLHIYLLAIFVNVLFLLSAVGTVLYCYQFGRWRFLALVITIPFCLYGYKLALDLPLYLHHDYSVAQGYPNFVYAPSRGGTYAMYIEGINFPIDFDESHLDDYTSKWFTVHYLPHSLFVVDYQMSER